MNKLEDIVVGFFVTVGIASIYLALIGLIGMSIIMMLVDLPSCK